MESFEKRSPERIQKLLRKRLEDKLHAKKYRRQLRTLGFYLSRRDGEGSDTQPTSPNSRDPEAPEGQQEETI
jgi:hypothetical protein